MSVKINYLEEPRNGNMAEQVQNYVRQNDPSGQIVFYGPSNFTRWSEAYGNPNLRQSLLGTSGAECCINRGFGSSCSEHQLFYYDKMVRAIKPNVLVYFFFANHRMYGYSDEEAWEIAQRVIAFARVDFPECELYICSPFRMKNKGANGSEERNEIMCSAVKTFCDLTPKCHYVDIYHEPTLQSDEIFIEDGVHYNPEGYARYADFWRKVLRDELAKF